MNSMNVLHKGSRAYHWLDGKPTKVRVTRIEMGGDGLPIAWCTVTGWFGQFPRGETLAASMEDLTDRITLPYDLALITGGN